MGFQDALLQTFKRTPGKFDSSPDLQATAARLVSQHPQVLKPLDDFNGSALNRQVWRPWEKVAIKGLHFWSQLVWRPKSDASFSKADSTEMKVSNTLASRATSSAKSKSEQIDRLLRSPDVFPEMCSDVFGDVSGDVFCDPDVFRATEKPVHGNVEGIRSQNAPLSNH